MSKPACPYCGSTKVMVRGRNPRLRYQCTDVKHKEGTSRYFYGEVSVAKVLLFDIETLPIEFLGWRLYDKILSPDQIKRDWCVLGYSAKWLFEPSHMSDILSPKEAVNRTDKRLVDKVHKLFNQADVIIAHNGDEFDIVKMNTRFIFHDMERPSSYMTVDTRKTASRAFGFTSNKLDYLGEYLGLGKKKHTDFDLWKRCDRGEKEALDEMHSYNARDLYLLEDVYVKLRPWIQHPNMALFIAADGDGYRCGRCGSDDIDIDHEHPYRTTASVFESYVCNNCGGRGRAKSRYRTTDGRVI